MSTTLPAHTNPFASHRVEALAYRWPGFVWPDLLARLAASGYRGAVVGPKGSGKTTLLDGLTPRLAERGVASLRVTLRADDRHPRCRLVSELAGANLTRLAVVVDGAEQLTAPSWLLLRLRCRRARGLVVTSHRPGRLPTVATCATSPTLLAELVAELAPAAAATLAPHLPQLWAERRGNLRLCLRDLYDELAGTGVIRPARS